MAYANYSLDLSDIVASRAAQMAALPAAYQPQIIGTAETSGFTQQPVVWDGGNNSACYAAAVSAIGAYGMGVATCATAETGIGAVACFSAGLGVFGATASAVSACNASANNGNGSAGPL